MGKHMAKYAFGDQDVLFDLPVGETENVECTKNTPVKLYADNSEYRIAETSKFRLLSSTAEITNAQRNHEARSV